MKFIDNIYSIERANSFRVESKEPINLNLSTNSFVLAELMEETMSKISKLDFTPHGFKLQKEYNWSVEKVNHALALYKEWLALQVHYEELSFAPSELVDEFWHVHILDTRKYYNDCQQIKGELIHHYPYFGLTEQENEKVLVQGFELTKKLYLHHFGRSDLGHDSKLAASCGCRSGNGSSCR